MPSKRKLEETFEQDSKKQKFYWDWLPKDIQKVIEAIANYNFILERKEKLQQLHKQLTETLKAVVELEREFKLISYDQPGKKYFVVTL